MKVGIITITTGCNYGNRLQNYALQQYLISMGIDAETLFNNEYKKAESQSIAKLIWYIMIPRGLYRFKKSLWIRQKRFCEFNNLYINKSKYYLGNPELDPEELVNYYDKFICGSDQIWNPYFPETIEENFLPFAKRGQRLTYAASFGVSEIPENVKEKYGERISEFDFLSVREETGKKLICELTGRNDSEVHIDPTLLLSVDEWNKIKRCPSNFSNSKYILVYLLGGIQKEIEDKVEELATSYNLKVINLRKNKYYRTNPAEFLYWIEHAEMIITNSFHGAVFSILYNKKFQICGRKGQQYSMSSRIDTLLNTFNITGRIVSHVDDIAMDIKDLNYAEIEELLKKKQKVSKEYLDEILK